MYQVYGNELCHFGVLGMKWGRRKGPSTKEMRTEREKQHDVELKKSFKKYNIKGKGNQEDPTKVEIRARLEAHKKTTDYLIKRYGERNVNKLNHSDKVRTASAMTSIAAIPVAVMAGAILLNK